MAAGLPPLISLGGNESVVIGRLSRGGLYSFRIRHVLMDKFCAYFSHAQACGIFLKQKQFGQTLILFFGIVKLFID